MKFVARVSQCPIFMAFDGEVVPRAVDQKDTHNIYLVSVSGADFAGREHDIKDITHYVTNWQKVYVLNGKELYAHGRDFVPVGVRAQINEKVLFSDLKKMARVRLRAQDQMGIVVVVETGIGLGVFSGDQIGCGDFVRTLSAKAVKEVLQEEKFSAIRLVVFSLPIFKVGKPDNFHFFEPAFKDYTGAVPVLILDNDMHSIALTCAKSFRTSELNPADSHGVFGEYWQNKGPGTEEKLALTTAGLLVQHHVVNKAVLDTKKYHLIDCGPPKEATDKKSS